MANREPSSRKASGHKESELVKIIGEKNARIAGLESNVQKLEQELAVAKLPRTRPRPIVIIQSSWFSALVTALVVILVAPLMLDYFRIMPLQEVYQFYQGLRASLLGR